MNSTMLFVLEARTWSVFVLIVGLGGALLRAHTVLEMVHLNPASGVARPRVKRAI